MVNGWGHWEVYRVLANNVEGLWELSWKILPYLWCKARSLCPILLETFFTLNLRLTGLSNRQTGTTYLQILLTTEFSEQRQDTWISVYHLWHRRTILDCDKMLIPFGYRCNFTIIWCIAYFNYLKRQLYTTGKDMTIFHMKVITPV